jgi:UV DNA damage repair endonuclease
MTNNYRVTQEMNKNMSIKRIGFACKWINDSSEIKGMKVNAADRDINGRSTTMRWLREHPAEAEQRQWDIMNHNASAILKLVERVGSLEPHLRMVRLGSEMLQGYTHKDWQAWWQRQEIQDHCSQIFAPVGEAARRLGVRISFHPGQFCVLASENPGIVERSIEEFEYHADMARWMGYGRTFQDMKINVHISGKRGPAGLRETYKKLSPEARNCITIENEENSWGLNDCLELTDILPIVMDIHHHWIREGEYIGPTDNRVRRVVDSWRGVRPTMHYSVSREDLLVDHDSSVKPDYKLLLESGYKKQKLRAHSNFMWNTEVNTWALQFLYRFDIMVEAKAKNLASFALARQAQELNLL